MAQALFRLQGKFTEGNRPSAFTSFDGSGREGATWIFEGRRKQA